jgi:hypothetical protein
MVLTLLYCLLLASCNGGGGSMIAGGGIDGTGYISTGVVSAFGSIVVNGTEFDTSEADVIVNGQKVGSGDDAILENLAIGMVVTVEGRIKEDNSVVADRIIYSVSVKGPVERVGGINPNTNEKEIVVLGQPVVTNFITKFEETAFDTIAVDDVIEVSGYLDFDGKIRATFIADVTKANIIEFEVTGLVETLDTNSKTFKINNLTVNYASIANGLPQGIPAEGLLVEVAGILDTLGGVIVARKIELGDELDGEDGDEFEIRGFVTEIFSDIDIIEFTMGYQVVQVDPDFVVFVDGTADDIVAGAKIEAEGSLEGGILIADEIEFWKPDQIEIEGLVSNVVSETEFTIEDQVVQTSSDTVFENVKPEKIIKGMKLEVKGVPLDIDFSVLIADKVSLEMD